MPTLRRVESAFVLLNQALIVFLMAAMTVLVFVNVLARYGFGASFGWAEELSRFAMIWTTFLGAGLALRYGQLVSVNILQGVLPPAGARALRIVSALLILAFVVALMVLGGQFAESSWGNRTSVLRLPKGLPYLAVPIGAAFLAVHLGFIWRRYVAGRFDEFIELDPDAESTDEAQRSGDAR